MIQIRPAQPDDAEQAALLLYSAYTHTSISTPAPDDLDRSWTARLEHFVREDGTRFSYHNIHIAEQNAVVVGLVLSFGGRDEARLNAAVGSWLEQEAEADEWYVDALAVFSNWSRQGTGTYLLHHAERQARQHHYPKVALHVAQENTSALALYEQQHYHVTEQTVLYDRPHLRMVKTLQDSEPGNDDPQRAP